jgi:hypothetical protein
MLNRCHIGQSPPGGARTALRSAGHSHRVSGSITGSDSTSAQLITCQPPRLRGSLAPSAYPRPQTATASSISPSPTNDVSPLAPGGPQRKPQHQCRAQQRQRPERWPQALAAPPHTPPCTAAAAPPAQSNAPPAQLQRQRRQQRKAQHHAPRHHSQRRHLGARRARLPAPQHHHQCQQPGNAGTRHQSATPAADPAPPAVWPAVSR